MGGAWLDLARLEPGSRLVSFAKSLGPSAVLNDFSLQLQETENRDSK
jgi:hypothetical protein